MQIRILASGRPASFGNNDSQFTTHTWKRETIAADIVIVGVGIVPDVELARRGGLKVGDGIAVSQ
ncbi:MAG TPA: hypothetical protein VFK88_03575 [Gallionella sp.]|nr:hypothetical protein [Gallionella sp.]